MSKLTDYRLYKAARVPLWSWDLTMDGYKPKNESQHKAADMVGRYMDSLPRDDGQGVFMYGPVGTGKTGLASEILKHALRSGLSGMFATQREYYTMHLRMREYAQLGMRDDYAMADSFTSRVEQAAYLVLDDVGRERAEGGTGFTTDLFDSLLRHRYNAGRPTIITTNKDVVEGDIKVFYNEGTDSFIWRACSVLPVLGGDKSPSKSPLMVND